MGRRMLGMGETTIDEVTVRAVKGRRGLRRITWRLGLGDGTTVQCRTEGRCSAAELRERARRQAERRLAEHLGTWADVTPDSPMAAYCLSRAIEDIEAAATAPDGGEALRPRSVYLQRRGHVLVTIEPGKAKTRRGRTVPVTDGRTAEMLLGRVEGLDPDAPVFPIASDPKTRWSDGDLAKRTRRLYDRAADELGVPDLHKVSTHVWRATLTTTWKTRGMSASTVAALLGHTPDTSERYYTDGVDMGELLKVLDERKGDAEPGIIKFRTA